MRTRSGSFAVVVAIAVSSFGAALAQKQAPPASGTAQGTGALLQQAAQFDH